MQYRKTILQSTSLSGIGVHGGEACEITFCPAKYGEGILFHCPEILEAHWKNVTSTHLSTTLHNGSDSGVSMVEHLLSACYGLGITDLNVHVKGREAPILDGSAKNYVEALEKAMPVASPQEETLWMVVRRPLRVSEGNRWVEWRPGPPLFSVAVTPDTEVLHSHTFDPLHHSFTGEIAPARTFMRLCDVEKMKAMGYIKGGSLDCSCVWDGGKPINEGGMILDNETARHKILDMMGDFALLGALIYGECHAFNPGHHLNYLLMCALRDQPDAVEWMTSHAIFDARDPLNFPSSDERDAYPVRFQYA